MIQNSAPQKKTFGQARLALFLVMFLFVLMMGFSVQDIARQLAAGKPPLAMPQLQAEEKTTVAENPALKKDMMKPEEKPAEKIPEKKDDKSAEKGTDKTSEAPSTALENYSDAEVTILKKLSERRQELEKRGRELDQREALIKVTEQRVDKKITDLKAMEDEIRKILGDANNKQEAQIDSLVKVYEVMKPKEAARIFDTLDMPIIIGVVTHMKEAKVAPILAAMDPQKAKQVTTALMDKKALPTLP